MYECNVQVLQCRHQTGPGYRELHIQCNIIPEMEASVRGERSLEKGFFGVALVRVCEVGGKWWWWWWGSTMGCCRENGPTVATGGRRAYTPSVCTVRAGGRWMRVCVLGVGGRGGVILRGVSPNRRDCSLYASIVADRMDRRSGNATGGAGVVT